MQVDVPVDQGGLEDGHAQLRDAGRRHAGGGAVGTSDDLQDGGVEQPAARAARRCRRRDEDVGREGEVGGRGLDETAVAALRRRGVQGAADMQAVLGHAGQEEDFALLAGGQGLGFEDTLVRDAQGGEVAGGLGSQQDLAAGGLDGPAVADQRVDRGFLDGEGDRAADVQRDLAAGAEEDGATGGGEIAFVDDLRGDHGDDAAPAVGHGDDVALVADTGLASTREDVVAGKEVRVGQGEGRRHEAADVDSGRGREQDAVGVEQEDLAVGREVALEDRGIGADDAVEGDGGGRGLDEADGLAGGDVEAPPLDDGPGGGLGDGHPRGGGGDGRLTGGDAAAGRQGRRLQAEARGDEQQAEEGLPGTGGTGGGLHAE